MKKVKKEEGRKESRLEGTSTLIEQFLVRPWPRRWSGLWGSEVLAPLSSRRQSPRARPPRDALALPGWLRRALPASSSSRLGPRPPGRPALPAAHCGLTFGKDGAHFQVAGGESDDGRLVQLRGDGRRQREQLGQLIKLSIFLLPPGLGRILGLLLHRASAPGILDPAALQARGAPLWLQRWRVGKGRRGPGESAAPAAGRCVGRLCAAAAPGAPHNPAAPPRAPPAAVPGAASSGLDCPAVPRAPTSRSFLLALPSSLLSPAPRLSVGDRKGPARERRCRLVLECVSGPAAPRPLRAGGRRRPRSHGAGREWRGAGAGAARARPGRALLPSPAVPCAWRHRARSLRSVARRSSSTAHVRPSCVCLWRTRLRAEHSAAGAQGGGAGGRDRGGGGGGEPRLPTPPRPRSRRRASASLPPGTPRGETGARTGSRKSW